MEILADTLEKLKCNYCEEYLYYGPIYLEHNGFACCGTCYSPERPATRNTYYEELAKLALFPCKYQGLGCKIYVPFVTESSTDHHEQICEYKEYECPLITPSCEWVGRSSGILKHCQEQHADQIVENSFMFTPDITKSSENTFLLKAFQMLFLLYIKVSVTSGKIYQSVQCIKGLEKADMFKYYVKIKRKNEELLKEGQVISRERSIFKESTSLVLNINSLPNVLGGWDDTTFTINIEQMATSLESCNASGLMVSELTYLDKHGWKCEQRGFKLNCRNKNCTYEDTYSKCTKHALYFCDKTRLCELCDETTDKILTHYTTYHAGITSRSGSTWRAHLSANIYRVLTSTVGIVICKYTLNSDAFTLQMYSAASRIELRNIRCVVKVMHPFLIRSRVYPLKCLYDSVEDWYLRITKKDFTYLAETCDVCVTITKVNE